MADQPSDPDDGTALDALLCFAVYEAGHAFNRIYKPHLDAIGLTYPQYLVMTLLWQRDDRTVGELGAALSLESSTLTPLLKRLEAAGHLERRRDAADERQVRIRLTETGRSLAQAGQAIPRCIAQQAGLRADEAERLRAAVAALASRLRGADPAES
ncbi:MarR family winged helix-turn-helix transcriptional regulator [Antarcticirhabdus aurantiaca]|uniref:MarR family transcriptional regulator n=1 Tax=Antarcticirhabdus aurantiaca TaxID=2606717 RepID=A0ACD4NQQ8_9HYPH|nr:MarR family transcriptional regulator [Antarcticirhabdus aurantiaca]WAJ29103.1 MarR family transcriptional regulator [Jeongeuplla avenae]